MKDLVKIRKQLGLSQGELGKVIGVSTSQVSNIEHGYGQLTLAQYGKMMKALRLTHAMQNQLIEDAISEAKPQRIRNNKPKD